MIEGKIPFEEAETTVVVFDEDVVTASGAALVTCTPEVCGDDCDEELI